MKVGSSQARRRRLIQGGLLGEPASPLAIPPVPAVSDDDADLRDSTERDIDLAASAILAPERESTDRQAGLAAIQSLIRGKREVTWVFAGDNVIQGACTTDGWRSCVELFAERMRAELRRATDVVINTGIAGDTAKHLLATLKRRVLRYRPEVVGFCVGINDAKRGAAGRANFRRDVREILDRIRNAGSVPLVILPHPIYTPASRNRIDLPHYVEILRDETLRDEVPCIDQWSDWNLNWPDPEIARSLLFDGRIQLNAAGHQHLAALIFRALGIYDSKSPACCGCQADES